MITGNAKTREVFINGELLDPAPSQKLYNHSPDGFSWGYQGSGPAQLALAILAHLFRDDIAFRHYQRLKREVIANLPMDQDFELEDDVIFKFMGVEASGL